MDIVVEGGKHLPLSEEALKQALTSVGLDASRAHSIAEDLIRKLRVSERSSVTDAELRVFLSSALRDTESARTVVDRLAQRGNLTADKQHESLSQGDQETSSWAIDAVNAPSRDPEEWLPKLQETYFSYFQYLHRMDRDTLSVLAAQDHTFGYAAMLWTRVHRAAAAKAIKELLPEFRDGLHDLSKALGPVGAPALWEHISRAVVNEAELPTFSTDLRKLRALLERTGISAEWVNDTLLADSAARAAASPDMLRIERNRLPNSFPIDLYEQERTDAEHPQVELPDPPEARLRDAAMARDGRYWAAWTCVEWPGFISTWPCACIKPASTWLGDYPIITELPPQEPAALKYPSSKLLSPQSWVTSAEVLELAYLWDKRVKRYLPSAAQIRFLPAGVPEVVLPYNLVLATAGMYDIDWEKLVERLEKEAQKLDDKVVQKIIESLKGQKVFGVPLDPLSNAASAAKDGLEALIQTILHWLISQLSGAKFPPLSITHKVEWVIPKGAKMTPDGTFESIPHSKVYLDALNKKGEITPLPLREGTPPSTKQGEPSATAVWDGESGLPDGWPAKTLKDLVIEKRDTGTVKEKSPVYWLPNNTYGLHAFVALREDQEEGSGEYWVAVRTEVRKVSAVMKK